MSESTSEKQNRHKGSTTRYLAFSLGDERYAVPLLSVKEVIAMPDITPIPQTPVHFLGIMNLRGRVISIIDLRLKFGLKAEGTGETAVIICDLSPELCLGVVVNSVDSVLNLSGEDIGPKPEIQSHKSSEYLQGVTKTGKNLVLLIDIAKALDVEDRVSVQAAAQHGAKAA